MWKEAVVTQFKVLFHYLPLGAEQNHEKLQSRFQVSTPRSKPGTSRIRCSSVNHTATSISGRRI